MSTLVRFARWCEGNAANIAATLSFAAVAAGFWMVYEPLGLIVPGAAVFALLVVRQLRG